MSEFLNDTFWLVTGSLITIFMWKATFSCTALFGVYTCVSHRFDFMSAFM